MPPKLEILNLSLHGTNDLLAQGAGESLGAFPPSIKEVSLAIGGDLHDEGLSGFAESLSLPLAHKVRLSFGQRNAEWDYSEDEKNAASDFYYISFTGCSQITDLSLSFFLLALDRTIGIPGKSNPKGSSLRILVSKCPRIQGKVDIDRDLKQGSKNFFRGAKAQSVLSMAFHPKAWKRTLALNPALTLTLTLTLTLIVTPS